MMLKDRHLVTANNDSIAAGGATLVVILRLAGAVRLIRVSASGASAVELDAAASTGDSVAFACAAGRSAGDGAWGAGVGAAGAAGAERWDVRADIRVRVGLGFGVRVDVGAGELGGELFESWGGEGLGADHAGLLWLVWLWRDDLRLVQWATLGDTTVGAHAAGLARRLGGGLGGGWLAGGDVKGVELAACGGLSDRVAGWVVGDVVAVNDVVVPVALALLEGLSLEAESALPATRLGRVLGERELTVVVVPRSEEMDSLAVGRSAEREVELDSGHFDINFFRGDLFLGFWYRVECK